MCASPATSFIFAQRHRRGRSCNGDSGSHPIPPLSIRGSHSNNASNAEGHAEGHASTKQALSSHTHRSTLHLLTAAFSPSVYCIAGDHRHALKAFSTHTFVHTFLHAMASHHLLIS
ncbi:hypothetical protein KP509_15G069200 [Ceratopteris richardii]|uniref:Uncharacterized protein n=1 Tax=Ceratopteris richardii TaxID=49495 RepID=A0A8T2T4I3_CERRI|nr:hypothetical protein KP509_15G069200 [Ceratopteris richardii]